VQSGRRTAAAFVVVQRRGKVDGVWWMVELVKASWSGRFDAFVRAAKRCQAFPHFPTNGRRRRSPEVVNVEGAACVVQLSGQPGLCRTLDGLHKILCGVGKVSTTMEGDLAGRAFGRGTSSEKLVDTVGPMIAVTDSKLRPLWRHAANDEEQWL